uniref:DUF7775 domain-containing protein n=1 Tax=Glossina brevipalpis TaxID=37001 RepID=A0A1A9X276_9MUSC
MKSMSSSPPADRINSLIMPRACGRQCLNLTNSCTHLAPPQSRKTLALLLLPANKMLPCTRSRHNGLSRSQALPIYPLHVNFWIVMHLIWCLFKAIEALLSAVCLIIHIQSLNKTQSMPHVIVFCGTYFGFMILSGFGCLGIILNRGTSAINECYMAIAGTLMYFSTSILGMHFAEKDYQLMYLSDFEEPLHPFFNSCKKQSECALVAGFIFLLHAFLALDVMLVHGPEEADEDNENYEATQPIHLYFICLEIHQILERKYPWFREFCTRPSTYRDSTQLSFINFREYDKVGDKARLRAVMSRMSVNGQLHNGSLRRYTRTTAFGRRTVSKSRADRRRTSITSKESTYNM